MSVSEQLTNPRAAYANKKATKKPMFAYARVLNFSQSKYKDFPKWLTEKAGFSEFMYNHYEEKLLSIPRICEKQQRASEELYLVNMFIMQISLFQGLPPTVMSIILNRLGTRYFHAGESIHTEGEICQFMAVVFVGTVLVGKTLKGKKEPILTGAFYRKKQPSVVAVEQTVLLVLPLSAYDQMCKHLTQQMDTKERTEVAELTKSTFFIEAGLKERRAREFRAALKVGLYLAGETVCEAGSAADTFYILLRGKVVEKNHVYVRRHNKWPAERRRWEVRTVYESHAKTRLLAPFDFFADEEIFNGVNLASTYLCEAPSVILSMPADHFRTILSTEQVKRLSKYRSEHPLLNYAEFEKNVRQRTAEQERCKKIVRQAINTSFRTSSLITPRKKTIIESCERHMLNNAHNLIS